MTTPARSLELAGARTSNPRGRKRGRGRGRRRNIEIVENPKAAAELNPEDNPRRKRRGRKGRKGRRRNWSRGRKRNGAGLGAAIGSTIGFLAGAGATAATVGGMTDMAGSAALPLVALGSIVGGAIGGHIGAPKDRKKRGLAGGAIGGIFGPIGAGIGGYIGGTKKDKHKNPSNPSAVGTALAVGLGLAAAGAGVLAYRGWKNMNQKKMPPGAALADSLDPGATLATSPAVVADVMLPVQLTSATLGNVVGFSYVPTITVLMQNDDGTYAGVDVLDVTFGTGEGGVADDAAISGHLKGGTPFHQRNEIVGQGDEPAVARLVTNVTGDFAHDLYERMVNEVANKDVNWNDPTARDASIKHVLSLAAPGVDYSHGLDPYTYGDPASTAWATAHLMGALAYQSYLNKHASASA